MIGLYFARKERKLRYGDNRTIRIGRTHKVKPPIKLCERGLHASKRPMDALEYAPGPILYLVELSGEIIHGDDKSVATERVYLFGFDATKLLHEFARKQILINIEKIKPYTDRYDLIIEYLNTGDEKLRSSAYSVAWAAACSADRPAIYASWSAEAAVCSVACSTAEAAACAAAGYDAEFVARVATRYTAKPAANEMLTRMIKEKTGWAI